MVNEFSLEVLAIIQARGGSKSIPRKNIRLLGGYPLISYSIAAAKQAKSVKRILVSTDDEEISIIAKKFGAEVPFLRPGELATDDSLDYPLFLHAIKWLKNNEGYSPDIVVQLRPTSPFRPPGLIDLGVKKLVEHSEADSVRAITLSKQNPYKMWKIGDDGFLKPLLKYELPEPYNLPRQKLPTTYWQTGHLDVIRYETIVNKRSLTGDKVLPLLIDPIYSVDIDTELDWKWAEWLLKEGRLNIVKPQKIGEEECFTNLPKLIALDFDGVLTDNRVWISEDGKEMVVSDRSDGMGISMLKQSGFKVVVISTERNPVVKERCKKLGIDVYQGIGNKLSVLKKIIEELDITLNDVLFVGNDINDLECIRAVGCGVAVSDAHPLVIEGAKWVLEHPGGRGAIRELSEILLKSKEEKNE